MSNIKIPLNMSNTKTILAFGFCILLGFVIGEHLFSSKKSNESPHAIIRALDSNDAKAFKAGIQALANAREVFSDEDGAVVPEQTMRYKIMEDYYFDPMQDDISRKIIINALMYEYSWRSVLRTLKKQKPSQDKLIAQLNLIMNLEIRGEINRNQVLLRLSDLRENKIGDFANEDIHPIKHLFDAVMLIDRENRGYSKQQQQVYLSSKKYKNKMN